MDGYGTADHYFELALDLPEKERRRLLERLDVEQPDIAEQVRGMLGTLVRNADFACHAGHGGARVRQSELGEARALDDIDHVAIQVGSIAQARSWYASRFACKIEYEDDTYAVLRFGNTRLALVVAGENPPHVCVAREDAAAFGELHTHRDGTRSAHVTDPWGNVIQVLEKSRDRG